MTEVQELAKFVVTRNINDLLSHWKGLDYPNTAYITIHAAFLARRGITGPKGFKETISGTH